MLHPVAPVDRDDPRLPQSKLEEAIGLAHGIDLVVVHAEVVNLSKIRPSTLLGKGTVERLKAVIAGETPRNRSAESDLPVEVCIVDAPLSPVQQRNLERAWNTKVIDRTGLILEIFGERARTKEGRLQVELAALTYQRSRLVRSWTHLERQRGGFGFLGGPGESQIETDRRLIGDRIARLNKELKEVTRTRQLHRRARQKVPHPVVALVGYTNAGKSTLFNRMTRSEVVARDQLFATLDPTMRGHELPSGRTVILSDTVGFISDLPHELVAAFRATLEEVCEADAIVHVRDISHPDSEAQKEDVDGVLRELGMGGLVDSGNAIEALNKTDLLPPEERTLVVNQARRQNTVAVPLSALTGEGVEELRGLIDVKLAEGHQVMDLEVAYSDGATMAWLYAHGDVLERRDDGESAALKVRLDPVNAERFRRRRDQPLQ